MSFELPLSPTLPELLRNVALNELDSALSRLQRGRPKDIHSARKHCKKLRAWLRLLSPRLPKDSRKSMDHAVRDAARAVAARRQAKVLQETLLVLAEHHDRHAAELKDWVRPVRRAVLKGDRAKGRELAQQQLVPLREAVEALDLSAVDIAAIEAGLRKGYRQARQRGRRAAKKPDAESMHDWRKRCKAHAYQCALLVPLWPVLEDRGHRLDRLNDALGEHHDLADLRAALRSIDALNHDIEQLIDAEQQRCTRAALAFGDTLFHDKSGDWSLALGERRVLPR